MNQNVKHSVLMLAAVAAFGLTAQPSLAADYAKQAQDMMKADFRSKGPATVEGVLQQDEAQKLCSAYPAPEKRPKKLAAKLEAEQLKLVKYPSDGQYMGRWQEGEKIVRQAGRAERRQLLRLPPAEQGRDLVRQYRPLAVPIRQAARGQRGDTEIHLGQTVQLAGLQRMFQYAALRPQGHSGRAAAERRAGAAAGPRFPRE
jgi:hypothetical protein